MPMADMGEAETIVSRVATEIGATGGFGADAAWGQLEAGAKVDFGANVEFDYGSTWHFEDMAQAERFREQLDDYLYDQWAMTHPACAMGVCMPRPTLGAEPPPVPTTKFSGVARPRWSWAGRRAPGGTRSC